MFASPVGTWSWSERTPPASHAGGRLVFHLFGALAQFEWEIIRDRTVAGLAAARARGRVGGRPSKLSAEQRRQARKMYDARELTIEQIGQVLGVGRTSIYRALGHTAAPVRPGAPAPAPPETTTPTGPVESVTATADTAEAGRAEQTSAPTPTPTPTSSPAGGAAPAARAGPGWFLVEADPSEPESGPVAVVSGQPEGGDGWPGPGWQSAGSRSGGGVAAAGPCRPADRFSAGVGLRGRAWRRGLRAAAVTARLTDGPLLRVRSTTAFRRWRGPDPDPDLELVRRLFVTEGRPGVPMRPGGSRATAG